MIGSFVSKGISIVSSVILARLLFEEDYGALVLSAIFAGLITQIGGMGYELFYLQHKGNEEERRKVLEQVFNLRLLTNFLMFVVQTVIGFYFFIFTENRTTGGILMMMAVSLMLEGFNAPQETLLKDNMEFKKITIGNIFKELFATIGKVVSAFLGFGGYSFGVGPVLGSLVRMFYLRSVQPYRHAYFLWDKGKIKEIFNFGKHVLFGSVGIYLVQQVDRIFLTLFFPQNIVGRYGFAWGNAAMPFNYFVMPQQQLIMTYVTRYNAGQIELFYNLKILKRLISFLNFPILTIAILFTEEIVIFLFTDKWLNTVDLIRVILLYYSILSLIFPFTSILTGLGRPDIVSKLTLMKGLTLIISLLFIGIYFPDQILIYILTYSTISILFDLIKIFVGISLTGIKFNETLKSFKIDFILIAILIISCILRIEYTDVGTGFSFLILILSFYIFLFLKVNKKETIEAVLVLKNKFFG